MIAKTYTCKNRPGKSADRELNSLFPGWRIYGSPFGVPEGYQNSVKIAVFVKRWHGEYSGYCREKYCNLFIPVWSPECGKRKKFLLVDLENNCQVRKITMQDIVNHFIGDGDSCIRWNAKNIDLERYADEMADIGYKFVISF